MTDQHFDPDVPLSATGKDGDTVRQRFGNWVALIDASPRLMTGVLSGNNNVSTMRFVLALMVLWSHSFALYYGTEKDEPLSIVMRGLYNAGNVGVACFLIMSGALVLRSWESSRDLRIFFIKRTRRLYPAYMMAVFLGAFVVAPIYADVNVIDLIRSEFFNWLFRNLVFQGYAPVDDVFTTSHVHIINGSLWSIYCEVICYIFLVLGAVIFRRHFARACLPLLATLIAARCYADHTGWNPGFGIIGRIFGWPYLWFAVAGWFVTGMLFYQYRHVTPRRRGILIAIFIFWPAIIWLPDTVLMAKILNDIFFTPMLAYTLFYMCSAPKLEIENYTRKYDLSYGMYLYAFPVQQIISAEFGSKLFFSLYFMASAICTMTISAASWIWIERRFLTMKTS